MEALYKLKDMLMNELEELSGRQELKAGGLDLAHKLTDTIKNIDKICALEEESGYSQAGEWRADMQGTYGHGNSYSNRGKHYVRGHYSRDSGNSRNMSRSRGYSQHGDSKERGIEMMRDLMSDAKDEREREFYRRCISEMQNF